MYSSHSTEMNTERLRELRLEEGRKEVAITLIAKTDCSASLLLTGTKLGLLYLCRGRFLTWTTHGSTFH